MNFGHAVDGPIAVITLNRPEHMNALAQALQNELRAAFERADADDVACAIIRRQDRTCPYDMNRRADYQTSN